MRERDQTKAAIDFRNKSKDARLGVSHAATSIFQIWDQRINKTLKDAIEARWKNLEAMHMGNKENYNPESYRLGLMDFDMALPLGPKVGLSRMDRLRRADAMQVRVDPEVRALIVEYPSVGEYVYNEIGPSYRIV